MELEYMLDVQLLFSNYQKFCDIIQNFIPILQQGDYLWLMFCDDYLLFVYQPENNQFTRKIIKEAVYKIQLQSTIDIEKSKIEFPNGYGIGIASENLKFFMIPNDVYNFQEIEINLFQKDDEEAALAINQTSDDYNVISTIPIRIEQKEIRKKHFLVKLTTTSGYFRNIFKKIDLEPSHTCITIKTDQKEYIQENLTDEKTKNTKEQSDNTYEQDVIIDINRPELQMSVRTTGKLLLNNTNEQEFEFLCDQESTNVINKCIFSIILLQIGLTISCDLYITNHIEDIKYTDDICWFLIANQEDLKRFL